jgi:hypothetical protein
MKLQKQWEQNMNFRDNIQSLSDIEIGLVIGGNGETEQTVDDNAPRDICYPWEVICPTPK